MLILKVTRNTLYHHMTLPHSVLKVADSHLNAVVVSVVLIWSLVKVVYITKLKCKTKWSKQKQ